MSTDLDCCIVTFNCGREYLDAHLFAGHLQAALATSSAPPDILVLALEEIAPIAYAFVGGHYLSSYLQRFREALDILAKSWGHTRYETVASMNAGMTALLVFAQPDIARNITAVDHAAVRVGDYELGNKGAVGARLHYQAGPATTQLTFVGAHLAPNEVKCERRNKDWEMIVQNMIFVHSAAGTRASSTRAGAESPEEAAPLLSDSSTTQDTRGLYSPHSHLFVAGDLNYRASDSAPTAEEAKNWPHPDDGFAKFKPLFASDQLTRELRAGRTLQHFEEADITFVPTYKYSDDAQRQASTETRVSKAWAEHRTPSWCDRVLYRPSNAGLKVVAYSNLPLMPSSDHRPVFLRASIPLTGGTEGETTKPSPFAISPDASARGPRSRAKELTVGMAMLVALTWEGRLMLIGTIAGALGGWALLRSLLWNMH